jgi:chromatin segregation and condensation protein Rec8/ScpA/Scc1 (kleisin family)
MVFSDDVGYYIGYLFLVILEFLHKKKIYFVQNANFTT